MCLFLTLNFLYEIPQALSLLVKDYVKNWVSIWLKVKSMPSSSSLRSVLMTSESSCCSILRRYLWGKSLYWVFELSKRFVDQFLALVAIFKWLSCVMLNITLFFKSWSTCVYCTRRKIWISDFFSSISETPCIHIHGTEHREHSLFVVSQVEWAALFVWQIFKYSTVPFDFWTVWYTEEFMVDLKTANKCKS